VAACVVLPHDFVPPGVNDSKLLSELERERCYQFIVTSAVGFGIGVVSPRVIDRINILRAAHEAMRSALANLPDSLDADIALIDGLPVHPFPIAQHAIVRGDASSASIAAASILAKVTRDRMMVELDRRFPHYLFSKHKGYGTREHLAALAKHGPCSEHRLTFKPVSAAQIQLVEPDGQYVIPFATLNGRGKTAVSSDKANLKAIGTSGEIIVRLHLERLGWTILEENFRCVAGEIDLIAQEPTEAGSVIVFIEVKTRRGRAHGSPISAVDQRKQARMAAVANTYIGIRAAGGNEPGCRFDIAEVRISSDGLASVSLHRAAFTA